MRRARYARSTASDCELIAEARLGHRLAARTGNERKVAARSGRQCLGQHRQDRDGNDRPGLLRLDGRDAVADVLAPEPHGIAAPEPGIEQDVKPNALTRTDRPSLLVCGYVLLCPRADTGIASAGRSLDASGRIGLDELHLDRPAKQRAHRVQKVLRLPRRMRSALQAGADSLWRYCRERSVACRLDHLPIYPVPLGTC